MKSRNNSPELEKTRASDRAHQRRLAALKRFSILSYTDWSSLRHRKMLPTDKKDYETYVDRKYQERDALDVRIKSIIGHA